MHTEYTRSIFMVDARVKLNQYSNKVLMVVKAKYELKDKSEALNKFIGEYGPNEVEPEVKEEYVKKILKLEKGYFTRKHKRYKSIGELRKEIEGD